MSNKKYVVGANFERKVKSNIEAGLQFYVDNGSFYKPTIVRSAGSKGVGDLMVGITFINNKQIWIVIQCKVGYVSKKLKDKTIRKCLRSGIKLFFATRDVDNKIIYYPDMREYIGSEIVHLHTN